MKRIILTSVLLSMGVTGEAMAACADDLPNCYTQVTDLAGLLQNNTVCDGRPGSWKGQEWHSGSSGQAKNLIDYKHGPSSTNDPIDQVGEWSISGDTVTRGYYKDTNNPAAGTLKFSNKVWQKSDGTYDFCDSNTLQLVTNVTIQTGQGACTGSHVPIACSASASSPTVIGSPATNVTPRVAKDIQDNQDSALQSPAKEGDQQGGRQAKPIAFPGTALPPTKEDDKQGEKDKRIKSPAKDADKQDEQDKTNVLPAKDVDQQGKLAKPIVFPGPILPPTKEGDKQGEQDKPIVSPAKDADKQGKRVKPVESPAKEGDKQGKQAN